MERHQDMRPPTFEHHKSNAQRQSALIFGNVEPMAMYLGGTANGEKSIIKFQSLSVSAPSSKKIEGAPYNMELRPTALYSDC